MKFFLFFLILTSSLLAASKGVITSFKIDSIAKKSILPGDKITFTLTVNYDDGKIKTVKSTNNKFRDNCLVKVSGAQFHAGQLLINKERNAIPLNQVTLVVTSKDVKSMTDTLVIAVSYFRKFTVKHERAYVNIGENMPLVIEATTNTEEVIKLNSQMNAQRWAWFDIKTSRGAIFDKGKMIIANDVRQFDCDTIYLTVTPEAADSLKQVISFTINYNKRFEAVFTGKNAPRAIKGKSAKGGGDNGGNGTDGQRGADGHNLEIYLGIHPCNKGLLKAEIKDTANNYTSYFILNKYEGSLKIQCRGGDGASGGDGANGNKGKNASKKNEAQDGGDGGDGGNGGDGGDGGQVTIYTSLQAMPYAHLIIVENKAGKLGKAGKKGKGKEGGKGTINFAEGNAGNDGVNGKPGDKGEDGGDPIIVTQDVEFNW